MNTTFNITGIAVIFENRETDTEARSELDIGKERLQQ